MIFAKITSTEGYFQHQNTLSDHISNLKDEDSVQFYLFIYFGPTFLPLILLQLRSAEVLMLQSWCYICLCFTKLRFWGEMQSLS